jgi:AraC-like DNA-binding protein
VKAPEAEHQVKAWTYRDILLESYRYAPGPAETLPRHSHEDYQFCLSLDFPGEYHYRGSNYDVPVGSLSIIHPGEMHSARDPEDRRKSANYRLMYVRPDLLTDAASEVAGRATGEPFFPSPIILDEDLGRRFLRLHASLGEPASELERGSRLLSVLTHLVRYNADTRPSSRPPAGAPWAVDLVREYLHDNYADNVSLEELARRANLSPYHLNRIFSREVGLPPHRYQIAVRVGHARELLARGTPITRVATETGFADHSHLTRTFKRFVQVPPSRYLPQNSKNVQDSGATLHDTAPDAR